ncbi:D-alanine--D-alanine ligase [Candidatus Wolfebacteria bacterium]|nr:D-alanine--D-alanine ligase [Candidatus Wolfebacteria bacterium]
MRRIRVGVLRGGPSNEYEVSLKTGAAVLGHLPEEQYEPLDILVDLSGRWFLRGAPVAPEELAWRVDVVFNALHGEYGEDGQVQRILERVGVPYTGSGVAASALAMHKGYAKRRFRTHGIRTPLCIELQEAHPDAARMVVEHVPPSYVLKPMRGGSSLGITFADGFHELPDALGKVFAVSPQVLVEHRIPGREATVGVIENFRGEDVYALPPIEIVPPASSPFFDYNAKYGGESQEICPGNFSPEVKHELQELARAVHRALRLRHYSRTDFILSPRGIYVLEVNTLPGLTEESLLPKSLRAVGSTFPDFLEHIVSLALE